MEFHVFAVWDFMSLLKSLQRKFTCVDVPWRPSKYSPELVRLINQIVLGEESDVDNTGRPISHFDLYLEAMKEIGASTKQMEKFLSSGETSDIPEGAREFVKMNLDCALNGSDVEVASSFFYGREKLIPAMFEKIVQTLEKENVAAPTLIYYLKRHIEVDSEEHGPLALKCLEMLTANNVELMKVSEDTASKALLARKALWDSVLSSLKSA